jgi:hypothetical protein
MDNVFRIALVLLVIALGASATAASAGGDAVAVELAPERTASFPHDCDWTWDLEQERCWWDRSHSLLLGGDGVRVWRGGVAFDLSALPAGSVALSAWLIVVDDGACLQRCDEDFLFEAAPVLRKDWFGEREPDVGAPAGLALDEAAARPEELALNVTPLVASWLSGAVPNRGLLLELVGDAESPGAPGVRLPVDEIRLEVVVLVPD